MKELIPGIVSRIPALMEHTTLSVSLCGWPAAVAIGLVCGTVVAITAIVTSNASDQTSTSPA